MTAIPPSNHKYYRIAIPSQYKTSSALSLSLREAKTMGAENKSNSNSNNRNNKKRKQRYLPHNFYEELHGKDSGPKHVTASSKPLNKITKFTDSDSDSSGSDDESYPNKEDTDHENKADEFEDTPAKKQSPEKEEENQADENEFAPVKEQRLETDHENQAVETEDIPAKKQGLETDHENQSEETVDPPAKKQRLETDGENEADETEGKALKKQHLESGTVKCENAGSEKTEEKSIDQLIEAELEELGDRNKRHFVSLDLGCNGVIFIQMHKRAGEPGPTEIALHMMKSAAATRKHMSRFILRLLPVEVTCYASEEEISKAIKPLIDRNFPTEAQTPQKFAVLFEARANTGIERMKIINSVAKSVPPPHKVDLSNPDKTIIVQVAKTMCLVGVVEKYKELSKFNLRQLTSPKP
ncbi:uncharacterized protein LOC131250836 isoform X2 [Magnolia sinica]|uniref:uncharacterized protein LOC131250836 isoform X2 n=1 Tax=Magnolia sinica TaxID=86752 RepID=UPI00265A4699|nr:uncharacterized protein LOC131250836 isoform X2 [Magnolia sinica]